MALGENLKGQVRINLLDVNSILIAGGSGSGKSVLIRSLLLQSKMKNAELWVGDFKGGLDYTGEWRKKCNIITDKEQWAKVLDDIIGIMHERITILRDAECENLAVYNKLHDKKMQYYIVCCDEISELLDKSGMASKSPQRNLIERIEASLSTLARQGRSTGISLILATQIPSREIISGQIISNMNLKIVGKADSTLSTMVLGNGEADKRIPKDKSGYFLTNSGILFKAYFVDKKCL